MESLTQKKISISINQKQFLANYKKLGFSDQSSIVREALNRFIKELKTKERKELMKKTAGELLRDYTEDRTLTAFMDLDGEEFL